MTIYVLRSLPVFTLLALASCAAPPPPAPPLPPVAKPAPLPPMSADWRDWPVSAGTWRYGPAAGGSLAVFAEAGAGGKLVLRCEKSSRRIFVFRTVSAPVVGQMTLRTSFGVVSWPIENGLTPTTRGLDAIAIRAASDSALDQMAFSRGRFAIEVPGIAPLVVPAGAEVGRVIEDCRG